MRAEHFCTSTTAESRAKFCASKMHFCLLVAWADVRSKAVILLLLIRC